MNVFIIGSENPAKDHNYDYHFKKAAEDIEHMDLIPINPVVEWGKHVKCFRIEPTKEDKLQWEKNKIKTCDYVYYLDSIEKDSAAMKLREYAKELNKPVIKITVFGHGWGKHR